MNTTTVTISTTGTTENVDSERYAIGVHAFERLYRQSDACPRSGAEIPEELHIAAGYEDSDALDALDDELRDRALTVSSFTASRAYVLFPGQGVDGSDVWALCDVLPTQAEELSGTEAVEVSIDEENSAEAWWDAARDALRSDAPGLSSAARDVMRRLASTHTVRVRTTRRIAAEIFAWGAGLDGWGDGPEYARDPLSVREIDGSDEG